MSLGLNYPLHGFAHTFIGALLIGIGWGFLAFRFRRTLTALMTTVLRLTYTPAKKRMVVSGVLGAWLHVALDMPIYHDIKPFWPFSTNPLLGSIEQDALYTYCAYAFIPALTLYLYYVIKTRRSQSEG